MSNNNNYYSGKFQVRLLLATISLPQMLAYLTLTIYVSMYPEIYKSVLPLFVSYALFALFILFNIVHMGLVYCFGMNPKEKVE